jgi:hypothetical protein
LGNILLWKAFAVVSSKQQPLKIGSPGAQSCQRTESNDMIGHRRGRIQFRPANIDHACPWRIHESGNVHLVSFLTIPPLLEGKPRLLAFACLETSFIQFFSFVFGLIESPFRNGLSPGAHECNVVLRAFSDVFHGTARSARNHDWIQQIEFFDHTPWAGAAGRMKSANVYCPQDEHPQIHRQELGDHTRVITSQARSPALQSRYVKVTRFAAWTGGLLASKTGR